MAHPLTSSVQYVPVVESGQRRLDVGEVGGDGVEVGFAAVRSAPPGAGYCERRAPSPLARVTYIRRRGVAADERFPLARPADRRADAGPVGGHPRRLRRLPAGRRRSGSARRAATPRATNCASNGWDQYVDVARSVEFQDALWVTVKFAAAHRAGGARRSASVSLCSPTSTCAARRLPVHLHLDRRHLRRRRQPDVVVPPATGCRRAGERRVVRRSLPGRQVSWAAPRPGHRPGVGRRVEHRGPSLGFTFLLVTAGLQSIPRDVHEAAAVDGAGGIRQFWSITVPLLGPTLLFVLIVLTTRAFQAYGEIDLLTREAGRARRTRRRRSPTSPTAPTRSSTTTSVCRRRSPCCCSSCCSVCRSSSSPASAGGCTTGRSTWPR